MNKFLCMNYKYFQHIREGGNMEPQGVNQRMFDMLETMREEQENLNRELAAKEEEKARFLDLLLRL